MDVLISGRRGVGIESNYKPTHFELVYWTGIVSKITSRVNSHRSSRN